jgi:hypothetical protein
MVAVGVRFFVRLIRGEEAGVVWMGMVGGWVDGWISWFHWVEERTVRRTA